MNERRIVLAAIAGAHGVSGELRLKLFSQTAADLERYGAFEAAGRTLTLAAIRPGAKGVIARFAEIADRSAAEALRGAELTVPRSALPPLGEGEYYHADLIGLTVVSMGVELGRVVAVENFGAGDVIEIECPDGKRFMVPMRAEAVVEWDGERLVIEPDFVA